jgi:putative ABC transport system substrate-binding protein
MALAQGLPAVGILHGADAAAFAPFLAAFRRGLAQAGYTEGKNVRFESRWAEGDPSRLPALARELVERGVALLFAASGIASALAAQQATRRVPIVFCMGADPVQHRLVERLSRPGGNATGVFLMEDEVQAKRLELLRQVAPAVRDVCVLVNPANVMAKHQWAVLRAAARSLDLQVRRLDVGTDAALHSAAAAIAAQRPHALMLVADSFFTSRRQQLVDLGRRHRLPSVFYLREYVAAGGLMSYGVSLAALYEQAGGYAAKVLAGARPELLPVAAPRQFELAINLRAAQALGIDIPAGLLARADELVQ